MVVVEILGVVKLFVFDAGFGEPVVRTEPPDVAAYQSITAPEEEAEMATVPVPQRELLLAVGALGAAFIVNVLIDVAFAHVPFPVAVSVNVTEPAVISAAFGV